MRWGAFPTQIDNSSDLSLLPSGQYSYYIHTEVTQESIVYHDLSSQSYAYFTLTGPEEYEVQFTGSLITPTVGKRLIIQFSLLDGDGNAVSRYNYTVTIDDSDYYVGTRFKFYTKDPGRYTVRMTASYEAIAYMYYSIDLYAPL